MENKIVRRIPLDVSSPVHPVARDRELRVAGAVVVCNREVRAHGAALPRDAVRVDVVGVWCTWREPRKRAQAAAVVLGQLHHAGGGLVEVEHVGKLVAVRARLLVADLVGTHALEAGRARRGGDLGVPFVGATRFVKAGADEVAWVDVREAQRSLCGDDGGKHDGACQELRASVSVLCGWAAIEDVLLETVRQELAGVELFVDREHQRHPTILHQTPTRFFGPFAL